MAGKEQNDLEELLRLKTSDKPGRDLSDLAKQKPDFDSMHRGLIALLKFIEHSRSQDAISEDTYYEVKGEVLKKLAHVKKFGRRDEYRRAERRYGEEAYEWGGAYDALDSEEVVENFIGRISAPASPRARVQRIASERGDLLEGKRNVEAVLQVLEEGYAEGSISQATYDELREENERKLERISQLLRETQEIREYRRRPAAAIAPRSTGYAGFGTSEFEESGEVDDDVGDILSKLDVNPPGSEEVQALKELELPPESPAEKAAREANEKEQKQAAQQQAAPPAAEHHDAGLGKLMERLRGTISSASSAATATAATQEQTPASAAPQPTLQYTAPTGQPAQFSSSFELELEKLKTKVDAFHEMQQGLNERLGGVMESVGEMRSMIFNVDSAVKKQEASTDQFIDLVKNLEPQKFMKELEKRDRSTEELSLRTEKLEAKVGEISENVSAVKSLLESIGSLRNIAEVNKDIGAKVNKMDGLIDKAERLNEDMSTKFVDIGNKIDEFSSYKNRQDLLVESVKELVGMMESFNKKLGEYHTKEEGKNIRSELEELKKGIAEINAKIVVFKQGGRELPAPVRELRKKLEGLKLILSATEEEYIEQKINAEDYAKVKQANEKKLRELEREYSQQLNELISEHSEQDFMSVAVGKGVEDEVEKTVFAAQTPATPEQAETTDDSDEIKQAITKAIMGVAPATAGKTTPQEKPNVAASTAATASTSYAQPEATTAQPAVPPTAGATQLTAVEAVKQMTAQPAKAVPNPLEKVKHLQEEIRAKAMPKIAEVSVSIGKIVQSVSTAIAKKKEAAAAEATLAPASSTQQTPPAPAAATAQATVQLPSPPMPAATTAPDALQITLPPSASPAPAPAPLTNEKQPTAVTPASNATASASNQVRVQIPLPKSIAQADALIQKLKQQLLKSIAKQEVKQPNDKQAGAKVPAQAQQEAVDELQGQPRGGDAAGSGLGVSSYQLRKAKKRKETKQTLSAISDIVKKAARTAKTLKPLPKDAAKNVVAEGNELPAAKTSGAKASAIKPAAAKSTTKNKGAPAKASPEKPRLEAKNLSLEQAAASANERKDLSKPQAALRQQQKAKKTATKPAVVSKKPASKAVPRETREQKRGRSA